MQTKMDVWFIIAAAGWQGERISLPPPCGDRRARWLVEWINPLKEVITVCEAKKPFHIEAMAILSEHLNAV